MRVQVMVLLVIIHTTPNLSLIPITDSTCRCPSRKLGITMDTQVSSRPRTSLKLSVRLLVNSELMIDILVRDPDPPMSSIYAVCDRVNQSQTPDSICKEAAKALRRHFKHGNEGERRAAAKIWLIMMRNIGNEVFRRMSFVLVIVRMRADGSDQAGSKKFMSPLETVLLAPPNKAVVSSATHRLLTEILADLTYMYGGEKGCEGLHDLWKKVKMPQEPEMVSVSPA